MNATAQFLRRFNAWRRGEEIDVASPFEIGKAIDTACELIEQRDEMLEALEEIIGEYVETGYISDTTKAESAIAKAKGASDPSEITITNQ
jgi:hypothetical protein